MTSPGGRKLRNFPQRVVASIGLGVALLALAAGIAGAATSGAGGGWFNYAPNSAVTFASPGLFGHSIWWPVATTAIAAVVWAAVSVWIFRPDGDAPAADRSD